MPVENEIHLPYYLHLSQQEIADMLSSLGLDDTNDHIIFYHLCLFARSRMSANVDIEKFILAFIDWAEKNNYTRFRFAQNLRRQLGIILYHLQEKHFVSLKTRGIEIESCTFLEMETTAVNKRYEAMKQNIALPYPAEEDLPIAPYQAILLPVNSAEFNEDSIKEGLLQQKILKINFADGQHILVPPLYLPDLMAIARQKVRNFVTDSIHARIVEDVIYRMRTVTPGKKLTIDILDRLFGGEEHENSRFFIYFCQELATMLLQEKEKKNYMQVVQSAQLIERYEITREQKAADAELQKKIEQEQETMREVLRDINGFFRKEDLVLFREGYIFSDGRQVNFTDMSPEKYYMMFEEVVFKLTQLPPRQEGENIDADFLPELVKLTTPETDYLVHRSKLIDLFISECKRVAFELSRFYITLWNKELMNNRQLKTMADDQAFQTELGDQLQKKFPALGALLNNPQMVYGAFFLTDTPREQFKKIENIFVSRSKAIYLPLLEILGLSREDLYNQAYHQLPFSRRFFLFRALKNLFENLLAIFSGGTSLPAAGKSRQSQPEDSGQETTERLKSTLSEINTKLCSDMDTDDKLNELERNWNIKLGKAREDIINQIVLDTAQRTASLVNMFNKIKRPETTFIENEIRNMAGLLKDKYKDIHNKKALEQYIMLLAIRNLEKKYNML